MPFRFRLCVILSLIGILFVPAPTPARAIPGGAAPPDAPTPFGVVATLANRVRDDEQDAAVALLREAGVQWAREEIFWDRLQPRKGGPYLWNGKGGGFYNYDASIQRLHQAGISILGQLDYNPAWRALQNSVVETRHPFRERKMRQCHPRQGSDAGAIITRAREYRG